tara:strand:+ start:11383 stop:13836 length:2454 start_codon:yes stop_codon:yes gene_type:complete
MNIKFLALTLATIGFQVGAKSFRGDDVFLKSFVQKINTLKSASDAHDIAGEATTVDPKNEGTIGHAATQFDKNVAETAKIIEKELAIGMRTNFIYIKEAITQYADDDGIVRDGVVFCNGKNDTDDSVAYTSPTKVSKGYAIGTANLVPSDGFGMDASTTATAKANEKTQCGRSNCEEGSFVTLVANRIRSLGYHVTHTDICEARTSTAFSGVPTCNLSSQSATFKAYECDEAEDVAGTDFYSLKKECFMAGKNGCSNNGKCDPIVENGYTYCLPNKPSNCDHNAVDDLFIETVGGANAANAVRRVIQYGTQENKVKTTDVAYVTGSVGGCSSLRQLVVALNGAAQTVAFRDTNILEAESHWNDVIEHTRSYLKSYAEILNDFYDKSTQIFPVIEFDNVEECPVGNVERKNTDRGDNTTPLCDQKVTDNVAEQLKLDLEGQILLRKRCFCRQGTQLREASNTLTTANSYEFDELYLMTKPPNATDCAVYKTYDAPSYYQYCMGNAFDDRTWRKTLTDLLPMKHAIKVFGGSSQALYRKLAETLPDDYDSGTSRGKINDKQSCGRLISTSKTAGSTLQSNKGGNCVPFRGMHDILFRLEFETSQNKQGTQSDCSKPDDQCSFAQVSCDNSDALENTLYSFRQFTYVWDHPMYTANTVNIKTSPVQSDSLNAWPAVFAPANVGTAASGKNQYQNSWSEGGNKLFRKADKKQMCNINWGLQITGDVARKDAKGTEYEDPYALFQREIAESIVNVEIAMSAKTRSVEDSDLLWAQIADQLTTFDTGSIASTLSTEVAKHFMRITTTDSTDAILDDMTGMSRL